MAGGLVNVGLVLLAAPFFQGVLRKVTARIQSRQGPPLLQPYFDLLKLLGKEDIESGEMPCMQQFAAYLSISTALAVTCLVPMGFPAPMNGAGDAILLIYLLTLSGICTLLGGPGGRLHVLARRHQPRNDEHDRPGTAVCHRDHHRRGAHAVVPPGHGAAWIGLRHQRLSWSGLIMIVVMLLSFQAFVQRVPFDISEAETEMMEGPLMEYSGPKLALFKYTSDGKTGDL